MRRAVFFSATLHATLALLLVAGAWLLPGQILPGRSPRAPEVLAEVELVVQNTPAVGRAAAPAAFSEQEAGEEQEAAKPGAAPVLPPPDLRPPGLRPSPGATPLPATRETAARGAAASSLPAEPLVPSGEPGSQGTGLVSGSQVIPAALDRTARNAPPAYPPRAVQDGDQGSVILRIHITADGSATGVDIVRTSGYGLLDEAAERAVGHWHFVAAREAGRAISSTMLLKIRFVLTNPEGGQ